MGVVVAVFCVLTCLPLAADQVSDLKLHAGLTAHIC